MALRNSFLKILFVDVLRYSKMESELTKGPKLFTQYLINEV